MKCKQNILPARWQGWTIAIRIDMLMKSLRRCVRAGFIVAAFYWHVSVPCAKLKGVYPNLVTPICVISNWNSISRERQKKVRINEKTKTKKNNKYRIRSYMLIVHHAHPHSKTAHWFNVIFMTLDQLNVDSMLSLLCWVNVDSMLIHRWCLLGSDL